MTECPIDLGTCADAELDSLQQLLADTGWCVVRHQQLEPAGLEAVAKRLGEPMFTPGEHPLTGTRFVFEVSNRGRTEPPKSVFHTDTSYVDDPPSISILAADEVPSAGGDTIVVNQYRAVETAPADLLTELDGVEILHLPSRVADDDAAGNGAWHPVLQRHPRSGRPAFYLTARERLGTVRRHGRILPADEAANLIERVHAQELAPPIERHRWREGDVVLIDNRCTLHAADHSTVVGHRTLHRVICRPRKPSTNPNGGTDNGRR